MDRRFKFSFRWEPSTSPVRMKVYVGPDGYAERWVGDLELTPAEAEAWQLLIGLAGRPFPEPAV